MGDANTVDLNVWLGQVRQVLPSISSASTELVDNGPWVKLSIQIDLPLTEQLLEQQPIVPGRFHVHQLQINLDVSKIVTFHEQNGRTACVLPYGNFLVNVEDDQVRLTGEQHKAIATIYRLYMCNGLRIVRSFPSVQTVNVDVRGQLPRKYNELHGALSGNNMPVFWTVQDMAPYATSIAVQTGRDLDEWQFKAVKRNKSKKEWVLEGSYMCPGVTLGCPHGVTGVDFFNLTEVRDCLHSDRRVAHSL